MTNSALRLTEMLADADALHEATEASQLSDIFWLQDEIKQLDTPENRRAALSVCINALEYKARLALAEFRALIADISVPEGDAGIDAAISALAARIDTFTARFHAIWEEIEIEELHLVIAYPDVLSGRFASHPPHLNDLAELVRTADGLLYWKPGPPWPNLLDLAVALVDLAGQLTAEPRLAEKSVEAARTAVGILRATIRAAPSAYKSQLGSALVALAKSLLEIGEIEEAAKAAAEARTFVEIYQMPDEVRGLLE